MSLREHAEYELALLGEDPDFVAMYLRVVDAFSSYGHSGTSAACAVPVIAKLLSWQPLTDLTDNPAEWTLIAESIAGRSDLWQSRRNPEAFSNDGGMTYTLNSERNIAGDEVTPLHRSVPHNPETTP